jgi:putative heme iron utilization protein
VEPYSAVLDSLLVGTHEGGARNGGRRGSGDVVTVPAPAVRQFIEAERNGVLATLSLRREGWPFASPAPYATTPDGEPLLLLSDLAEHTRNLRADPRASLLIQDSHAREDPLAGARITLLGTAEEAGNEPEARERYAERHPQAMQYLGLGDFRVWVLRLNAARFVNGFGEMGWLEGDRLRLALAG